MNPLLTFALDSAPGPFLILVIRETSPQALIGNIALSQHIMSARASDKVLPFKCSLALKSDFKKCPYNSVTPLTECHDFWLERKQESLALCSEKQSQQ